MQNNKAELWTLLNFLMPHIFDDINTFHAWFATTTIPDDRVVPMLREVVDAFILRRLKADVEIQLPPKRDIVVWTKSMQKEQEPSPSQYVEMHPTEQTICHLSASLSLAVTQAQQRLYITTKNQQEARKITNHPWLVTYPQGRVRDQCITGSGKMGLLNSALVELQRQGGHKVNLCAACHRNELFSTCNALQVTHADLACNECETHRYCSIHNGPRCWTS